MRAGGVIHASVRSVRSGFASVVLLFDGGEEVVVGEWFVLRGVSERDGAGEDGVLTNGGVDDVDGAGFGVLI
jgi:hypothetical protein